MDKKFTLIASKGSLDWAYHPFSLASSGAALGYDCTIFFTHHGLNLLKKNLDNLKVSSFALAGVPMPAPIPDMFQTLPGMQSLMTHLWKKKMKDKGITSIEELRTLCQEAGVKFIACKMTMDLFDFSASDFIEGVEIGSAAAFFEVAGDTNISFNL